jgi:peroxiredoxin
MSSITEGARAPALALPDERGEPVALPQPGQLALLVFYRGDW